MAEENNGKPNVSVTVPLGIVTAASLAAVAAAAAYLLTNREEGEETGSAVREKARSGRSMGKRLGLMALITLIENDATRKVVVAVLRAMARRA